MTAPSEPVARGALTTPKIVFIVIAAAAPLAAIVGTVPLMIARGNGAGVPGAFVLAGATLILFALGYAAMARHVVNTGAFYTYVAHGLGRRVSVVAALVAVIAYNAQTVGQIGGFGFFTQLGTGGVPWWVAALVSVAVVGVLGYRTVDVSARVLAVLMTLEILLLGLLDVGIVARLGTAAFPVHVLAPSTVVSAGLPIAVLFSFSCFIGFESAALYAEETTDPRRTIPRATYAAVVVIGLFYAFTAWLAVGAESGAGIEQLRRESSDQVGQLYFTLMTRYVGSWASGLMGLMVLTSLIAAILATHNASARYMFALGREGVLPRVLGGLHGRHLSPHRASLTQSAFNLLVVGLFALAGLDPYIGLASTMIGLGTLGIVALQAMAAFAVVGFFRRRDDAHWFATRLAPGVGGVGLAVAVALTAFNFRVLSNSDSLILDALPGLYLVAAIAGIGYATWLRRNRREVFDGIAESTFRQILVGTPDPAPGPGTAP
ncbi:MAG TPA: APC family permease [Kineosporiaceae bacterium]